MELHILLAGVEFGPYTDERARQLLGEGFLSASDPAKRLDETKWIPLSTLLTQAPEEPSVGDKGKESPGSASNSAPGDFIETSENFGKEEPAVAGPFETPEQYESPDTNVTVGKPSLEPELEPPGKPAASTPPEERKRYTGFLPTARAPAPLFQVSIPSRTKKIGRTGSLLAKEALHAAAERAPFTSPTASVRLPPSEQAPNRKRLPLVIGEPEGIPAKPAMPRQAIRLTGRISLPGATVEQTAPRDAPPTSVSKLDREATEPMGPPPTGKSAEPEKSPPVSPAPADTFSTTHEPPSEGVLVGEIARPGTYHEDESPDMTGSAITFGSVFSTALEQHESPETFTTASPKGPDQTADPTELDEPLEKSSLKITGSTKQPTSRTAIQLGSSPKTEETGAAGFRAEEAESAIEPPSSTEFVERPPAPEESLPPRPPTGKIPVSEMPTEGVRVRTRRLTNKINLPGSEPESVPLEGEAGTTLSPGPESSFDVPTTASGEVARPEKIRLRRPVKLELSSRAKVQDSGRLTLEAFSKMASVDLASKSQAILRPEIAGNLKPREMPAPRALRSPISMPLPEPTPEPSAVPVPSEEPISEAKPPAPTQSPENPETVPSTAGTPEEPVRQPGPVASTPMPKIDGPAEAEVSPAVTPREQPTEKPEPAAANAGVSAEPPVEESRMVRSMVYPAGGRESSWKWLIYAIIALGLISGGVLLYFYFHSLPGTAGEPAETNSGAAAGSASPPPDVASATPPTPAANPAPRDANSATSVQSQLARQVDSFISQGIGHYQQNDIDGALAAYNQALDLNPRSADALYNRGMAKAAHEDLDGAIADYSQALQIDPKMAVAFYYRGLARHAKGDLNGAASDYNQDVQMDPKNAQAYFNRGLIRMQKDNLDGAVDDSTRALELDPHQIQAYYDRGLGRLAKGNLDGAAQDMKTFCQLAPQDAYADYARIYLWLITTQQGQLADANQALSSAMNKNWNAAADSMVTRVGEYLLGQIGENDLINAAASSIPAKDQGQHCEAWYFMGMRHLEEGDKAGAAVNLRKCVGTEKTDYCEYILAQEELKALSPGGNATGSLSLPTGLPPAQQPESTPPPAKPALTPTSPPAKPAAAIFTDPTTRSVPKSSSTSKPAPMVAKSVHQAPRTRPVAASIVPPVALPLSSSESPPRAVLVASPGVSPPSDGPMRF